MLSTNGSLTQRLDCPPIGDPQADSLHAERTAASAPDPLAELTPAPAIEDPIEVGPEMPDEPATSLGWRLIPNSVSHAIFALLLRVSFSAAAAWLRFVDPPNDEQVSWLKPLVERTHDAVDASMALDRFNITPTNYALGLARLDGTNAVLNLNKKLPLPDATLERLVLTQVQRSDPEAIVALLPTLSRSSLLHRRVLDALVERAPLVALQLKAASPELHALDEADAFRRAITADPRSVATKLDLLPSLQGPEARRLAEALSSTDPSLLIGIMHKLALTEEETTALLTPLLRGNLPLFLDVQNSLPIQSPDLRAAVVVECLRANGRDALEVLDRLLDWSGPIDLSAAVSDEAMQPYWRRILRRRDELGIGDSECAKQLAMTKALTKPKLLAKALPELALGRAEWAPEVGERLAEQLPREIPEIVSHCGITRPELLSRLALKLAEVDATRAEKWVRTKDIAVSEEFRAALLRMRSAQNPWKTLRAWSRAENTDPEKHGFLYINCAKDNAAKVCREISKWRNVGPALREKIFETCGARNLWQTLKCVDAFQVKGSASALALFHRAVAKDPHRAFELRHSLGINLRQDLRTALHVAVSASAIRTMPLILDRSYDEAVRCEAAMQAVRKNPRAFYDFKREIPNKFGAESLLRIVAAAAHGDIGRAMEICKQSQKFCTSDADRAILSPEKIGRACALEDLGRALRTAPATMRMQFREPSFLSQIAGTAVVTGRWNSALEAAKQLAGVERGDGEEGRMLAALATLDSLGQTLNGREDLDARERESLELFMKIRKASCIPTDTIQRTLDHFGIDDLPFLLGVLEQSGSTAGEGIFSVLLQSHPTDFDVPLTEQKIVHECIALGFRGLSPRLLKRLVPVFERSPVEGKSSIRTYQEAASRVLTGKPVPAELESSPLYPGLVTAAFRPVGMTESIVADLLRTVSDHSQHLARFTFAPDGYPMNLGSVAAVSLRPGQAFNVDDIRRIVAALHQDVSQEKRLTPAAMVRRLLQGAFDRLDHAALWQLYSEYSKDPRVSAITKRIGEPQALKNDPPAMAKRLSYLAEAYGVIASDAAVAVAELALHAETAAELQYRFDRKGQEQVRKILRLSAESAVAVNELRLALEVQIAKIFRNEQALINRESKKLTQHIRELGDRYTMYLSKSKPAYFGRAGAGLCTSQENWSWNNPNFLQMIMVDRVKNIIVGNIQLHLFKNRNGEASILARINPTSTFLAATDHKTLAAEMTRVVREFAAQNGLQPYLPEQTRWHELTNRDGFSPALKRYYGEGENTSVQLTAYHSIGRVYRMKSAPAPA